MSATLTPGRISPGSTNGSGIPRTGITPGRHRRRSLPMVAVAVACMVGAIVAFVGIDLASTNRHPVLAVARPVQAGATITANDLAVAQISTDPALKPIPLSAKASVVGQRATENLSPGMLLTPSAVGGNSLIGNGEALVGIALPAGAAPVDAIAAGDRVQVIEVDKADDATSGDTALGQVLTVGRVEGVSAGDSAGGARRSCR